MSVVASVRLGVYGITASNFTDPKHERMIYFAVGALVLLGILMIVGTVVWWRGTRSEHSALAPLELMGSRSWDKASFPERRRRLDNVRVRTAEAADATPPPERLDLDASLRAFEPGFDDLRDDPVVVLSPGPADVPDPEGEDVQSSAVEAISPAVTVAVTETETEPVAE